MTTPALQLTQYQVDSAAVHARFRLKRWCRQSGKTFEETRELVEDAHARRTRWVILSRGERQSKQNIEQCALHSQAYGAAAQVLNDTWEGEEGTYKSARIDLPNGSSILGLPANPDTARGFSANVYLDEFAFHKNSRAIWAALFPIITRGYQLRITSTPQGKQNKFYELDTAWSKKMAEGDGHYHTHKLDIYDAVRQGLRLVDEDGQVTAPEHLKDALGDEDAWDQEYLVQYLDEATAYLSLDLIASCEDPELAAEPVWLAGLLAAAEEVHRIYLRTKVLPPSYEVLGEVLRSAINAEDLYLGGDIARKRDYTVFWLFRKLDQKLDTVAVIRLRKVPFFIQQIVLHSLLAHPSMRRACLDQTGLGLQLAETAVERFGDRVEGIDFTVANKELLATGLKQKMEDRLPVIPAEVYIRNSFHAIKRLPTGTGHFRFDAERTEATGHADEFWSCALAAHAASAAGPPAAGVSGEAGRLDWTARRQEILSGAGAQRHYDRRGRLWFAGGGRR
ncbi:MAG: hypothetical protein H8K10_15505 [Nitrospira sp.]|nr:hypothetical protein [Nitrospira sp.]